MTGKPRNDWNSDEVSDLLSGFSDKEMLEKHGRSRKACQMKRHALGYAKRPVWRWTPRDEETLLQIYPLRTNEQIAAALGRSLYAIKQKAAELGLRKRLGPHAKS